MDKLAPMRIMTAMNKPPHTQKKRSALGPAIAKVDTPPAWVAPVKLRMKELGLIQQDLVRVLDVRTRGAIGHYFRGRRQASVTQLQALADYLDLDMNSMLYGEKVSGGGKLMQQARAARDSLMDFDYDSGDVESVEATRALLIAMLANASRRREKAHVDQLEADRSLAGAEASGDEEAVSAARDWLDRTIENFKEADAHFSELSTSVDIGKATAQKVRARSDPNLVELMIETRSDPAIDHPEGVPLIHWAGIMKWVDGELPRTFEPDHRLLCPVTRRGARTFVLEVGDDSMESPAGKSYPRGCFIFVDPDPKERPEPGDRVIALPDNGNRVLFRQLAEDREGPYLKALSANYESTYGDFYVAGIVIGKWEPEVPQFI